MRITRTRGQCPAPEPDRKSRTLLRRAYPMSGSACAIRRAAVRVRGGTTTTARACKCDQRMGCAAQSLKTAGAYKKRAAESAKEGDFDMAAADLLRALMRPVRPSHRILSPWPCPPPPVTACGDSLAAASAPQHLFEVAHSGTVSRAMFYGSGAFSGSCAPRARCMA